jgi:hypothetical protein
VEHDIIGEQRNKPLHVGSTRCLEKPVRQLPMVLAVDGKAGTFLRHAGAGSAQDFAAGGSVSPDRTADLIEGEIEGVPQHEDNAFQRRKTFEHHE